MLRFRVIEYMRFTISTYFFAWNILMLITRVSIELTLSILDKFSNNLLENQRFNEKILLFTFYSIYITNFEVPYISNIFNRNYPLIFIIISHVLTHDSPLCRNSLSYISFAFAFSREGDDCQASNHQFAQIGRESRVEKDMGRDL